MRFLIFSIGFALALLLSACGDKESKAANQEVEQARHESQESISNEGGESTTASLADTSSCELKAFGASPPLSVLLEILCPKCMIGLNYKPYPEDVPFMPDNVVNLPILGHIGNNSLSFEEIATLKPDVMFFSEQTLDSILEPYVNIGIEVVKVPTDDYIQAIKVYAEALGKDKICGEDIHTRSSNLIRFIERSNAMLGAIASQLSEDTANKRPSVYFAQGFDGLKTQCGKNDKKDLAYKIGGINVIDCEILSTEQQAGIDFELLAKLNPQVIFVRELPLFKELSENPNEKWNALEAISQKRFYYAPSTPSNWLMRPSSIMQSIGLIWAANKLHPNLISNEEAKIYTQEFFSDFLKPLSDEEYARIQGL
ncbi:ABC transporter substrate-binding protein [Helicobacter sp. MIT 21-1697]|uniref:ABC transporter substrate-binding protein n=1 Tax=Helicobacter sp. MIT 21-1697 TaxID=2993733 RepID=UPI00224AED3A|nr:ABC transporter substrate-binding protein [Helicobacter sp. MIT 21-1697]MCX2716799.1 ABC transporter substrate-binding protein [Helicobacter sp. MIT 21-1697]